MRARKVIACKLALVEEKVSGYPTRQLVFTEVYYGYFVRGAPPPLRRDGTTQRVVSQ